MGLFKQLSKTAHNLALDGLERIGVTINVPHFEDDDDEKSLLDLYFSHFKTAKSETRYPVNEEMMPSLKREFYPLCGSNQTIRDTLDSWFKDRKSILSEVDFQLQSIDDARKEAMKILEHAGIIVLLPNSRTEWLPTLQHISNIQNRNIINLLHQAVHQIDNEYPEIDFNVWHHSLNEKVSRFNITVVRLPDDFISISDLP